MNGDITRASALPSHETGSVGRRVPTEWFLALRLRESTSSGNLFLERVPKSAATRIREIASLIQLTVREPLIEAGQPVDFAYFPLEGMISNVITMAGGEMLEVGVIGREGIAGCTAGLTGGLSATTLYAQGAGSALKIARTDLLPALAQSGMELLFAYTESQIAALSQFAACNRLHTTDQRFARWLLMAHDRFAGDAIMLTQELLALMLGVRRPGVTVAAMAFQRAGSISYHRGRITIVDRRALLAASCECYASVERRFADLMGYSIRK